MAEAPLKGSDDAVLSSEVPPEKTAEVLQMEYLAGTVCLGLEEGVTGRDRQELQEELVAGWTYPVLVVKMAGRACSEAKEE